MASSNSASWMGNSGRKYMANSRMMNNNSPIEPTVMQYHCGIPIALKTDGTSSNQDIRFYSCPNTWGGRGGCGLFVWADNKNDQVVIIDFLRKMKVDNEKLLKELHAMKEEVGKTVTIAKMMVKEKKMFNGMLLIIVVLAIVVVSILWK
ncbi:hypothetical protein ACFE04_030577 [Oxalis oulophora]